MSPLPVSLNWKVFADRVQGASHAKIERESQDYCAVKEMGNYVCLVLADGHGSARSPCSATGASWAVQAALKHFDDFVSKTHALPVEQVTKLAKENLPKLILRTWIDNIKRSNIDAPYSELLIRYGTTLVGVLITDRMIMYLQIGDGDILKVSKNGSVTRPIPSDSRNFANETVSMAMTDPRTGQPNAHLNMNIYIEEIGTNPAPELILVSTDGYSNSFRTEEDFLKAGRDFLGSIRNDGWKNTCIQLPIWLKETTEQGSGDDIAVGLIYRTSEKN